MVPIKTLTDVKHRFQDVFDKNEETVSLFGEYSSVQLKVYLVENSGQLRTPPPLMRGTWSSIDTKGWYIADGLDHPETFFLDASGDRVWRVFSLLRANDSDTVLENWLKASHGLDSCWLQRSQLLLWLGREGWIERGYGIRFADGLVAESDRGYFSLKAWHGATRILPELQEVVDKAKERFAISSVRWERRTQGQTSLLAECYSSGKVTINRADDVEEVIHLTSELSNRYENALLEADKARSKSLVPFELDFGRELDLDAFGSTVRAGRGPMKLWLTEVERSSDFRSYKGVDLHTGDRVFLDVGLDYAYLNIPGKGCVNAAPRLAVIQGEDNAGLTQVRYDGVEVFA